MKGDNYVFGMVGLGVMGRNLLLNMADNGFKVAGYDKDAAKVEQLGSESVKGVVKGFTSLQEFVDSLQKPRAVMLLVPAGKIVDSVLPRSAPLLDAGDIIIDGGNSHYTDTNRRVIELKARDFTFSAWVYREVKRVRETDRA